MARDPHPVLRRLPLIIGGLVVLLGVAGFFLFVHKVAQAPEKPKRETPQVVQIVRPPPPPPDQPPPPPPEEKVEEPLPQDAPEPEPADAAPAEQLGLDAEGVAGGDGFGLAARRGGSDITGTGSAAFAWYTGMLKDTILGALEEDQRVRKGSYRVTIRVWLAGDGRVERAQLTESTGSRDLDAAIEQALGRVGRLREAPPLEMPQPVTLRIVSRG
jgi:protein TonB